MGINVLRGTKHLWEESEGFSKERDRLESYFHRLQSQRVRLEQCLTVSLPPPSSSSSSSSSPSSESVQRGVSSSSSSSNSASPSNNNSHSNSDNDNNVRTNNTTLRAAVDEAAAAALVDSTLPTATWSTSFYVDFWQETSQQKLSYVEEKNLAGRKSTVQCNAIQYILITVILARN